MYFHDCCLCVEWICVHNAALSYLRVLCIPEESPRLSTVRLSLRRTHGLRKTSTFPGGPVGIIPDKMHRESAWGVDWGRHSHQHGPGAEPPALCNKSVMDTFKHKLKTYPFWHWQTSPGDAEAFLWFWRRGTSFKTIGLVPILSIIVRQNVWRRVFPGPSGRLGQLEGMSPNVTFACLKDLLLVSESCWSRYADEGIKRWIIRI